MCIDTYLGLEPSSGGGAVDGCAGPVFDSVEEPVYATMRFRFTYRKQVHTKDNPSLHRCPHGGVSAAGMTPANAHARSSSATRALELASCSRNAALSAVSFLNTAVRSADSTQCFVLYCVHGALGEPKCVRVYHLFAFEMKTQSVDRQSWCCHCYVNRCTVTKISTSNAIAGYLRLYTGHHSAGRYHFGGAILYTQARRSLYLPLQRFLYLISSVSSTSVMSAT
jgi:hypothetical protein